MRVASRLRVDPAERIDDALGLAVRHGASTERMDRRDPDLDLVQVEDGRQRLPQRVRQHAAAKAHRAPMGRPECLHLNLEHREVGDPAPYHLHLSVGHRKRRAVAQFDASGGAVVAHHSIHRCVVERRVADRQRVGHRLVGMVGRVVTVREPMQRVAGRHDFGEQAAQRRRDGELLDDHRPVFRRKADEAGDGRPDVPMRRRIAFLGAAGRGSF